MESEAEEKARVIAALRCVASGNCRGCTEDVVAALEIIDALMDRKAEDDSHYLSGYQAAQSLNLQREEAAHDKGYDAGWNARDQMADQEVAKAQAVGFVEGVTKALEQRSSSYLRN